MELKGFILWNDDLKRVGYVYPTKEGAEFSKFKKCFIDAYNVGVRGRDFMLTKETVEELADNALAFMPRSPHEVREVTVIIKENE